MSQLTDIAQALPLGAFLALLWLAVARRSSKTLASTLRPLWILVVLLSALSLLLGLIEKAALRPAGALLGISLLGFAASTWIARGSPIALSGKKRGKRKRGRHARTLEIEPRAFAPVLPFAAIAGVVVALLLPRAEPPAVIAQAKPAPEQPATPATPATPSAPSEPLIAESTAPQPAPTKPEPPTPVVAEATLPSPEPRPVAPAPEDPPPPPAPSAPLPEAAMATNPGTAPATPEPAEPTGTTEPANPAPPVSPQLAATPEPVLVAGSIEKTVSFRKHVVPILNRSCLSCHDAEKQKGELRLDTPDLIRKGGKNGAIIVAGRADRSPFYTMTTLPADDADVMPSKGDLLTAAEQQILRTWVDEGADLEDGKPFASLAVAPAGVPQTALAVAADATPIDPKVLATLQRRLVVLRPLNAEHTLFEAVLRAPDPAYPKPDLKLLESIYANLHTLDLARTGIADSDLGFLQKCPNLTVLRLAQTPIGDGALTHLAGLEKLESLNLTGTKVTNAGLKALQDLPALKEVFAVGTEITGLAADVYTSTTGVTVRAGF